MLKKIKFETINILIISLVIIFGYQFVAFDIDHAWTMNCAINITKGYIPYKDFNFILTPLYYFLGAFFMLISSSSQMFLFFSSLILIFLLFINHKFFTLLMNKNVVVFDILFSMFLIFCPSAYNCLSLTFIYCALYILFKNFDNLTKINIVTISIFCFLSCFTKQTVGVCLSIFIFTTLIYVLKKQEKIKKIIFFFIPFLIFGFSFIFYLIITNSFYEFFDHCVFGISRFNNSYTIIDHIIKNPISLLYFGLVLIMYIFNLYKIKKQKDIKSIIMIIFSILCFIYTIPICNWAHLDISICPLLTLTFINLSNTINYKVQKKYNIFLLIIALINILGVTYLNIEEKTLINNGYIKNTYVKKKEVEKIKPIIEYMKNKDVVFYSVEECLVLNNLIQGINTTDEFACFLIGNTGTKDYLDIVQSKKEGYFYIYNNEEFFFWQTPNSTRDFIIENYELIDTIENFDIYKISSN